MRLSKRFFWSGYDKCFQLTIFIDKKKKEKESVESIHLSCVSHSHNVVLYCQ